MKKQYWLIGILWILTLFVLPAQITEGAESPLNEKWESLWKQSGGGDQVYLQKGTLAKVDMGEENTVYGGVLLSRWSYDGEQRIIDEMIQNGDFQKAEDSKLFFGTIYQIEMDVGNWAYRVVRVGYLRKDQTEVWQELSTGEWSSLNGSEMAEPLSAFAVETYLQKIDAHLIPVKKSELSSEGMIQENKSSSWIEYSQSSWGRYFFLPEKIEVRHLPERSDSVILQLIVRSDWSLQAQKEAPEIENWVRQKDGMAPISGLERTDKDYMVWCLDLTKGERSYLAGVYLDNRKEQIFKEGSFLTYHWTEWDGPALAGAAAAYLLSHPEFSPQDAGVSPVVEMSDDLIERF